MSRKYSGFALIELLIVIFIIVLFSGITIAYFGSFNERRKIDLEVNKLINFLDLAAEKTSSADMTPDPECADFQGYRVLIETQGTYTLEFNCGGAYYVVQRNTLGPGMTLSGVGTNILYKPLSLGTNLQSSTDIIITNVGDGKCSIVRIAPVGSVEEIPDCN